jgi:hypothetical protein
MFLVSPLFVSLTCGWKAAAVGLLPLVGVQTVATVSSRGSK